MLISNRARRRLGEFAAWLKRRSIVGALVATKFFETVLIIFFPTKVAQAVAWGGLLALYIVTHVWREKVNELKEAGVETVEGGADAVTDAVDGDG